VLDRRGRLCLTGEDACPTSPGVYQEANKRQRQPRQARTPVLPVLGCARKPTSAKDSRAGSLVDNPIYSVQIAQVNARAM
jgi:hypothetical protein